MNSEPHLIEAGRQHKACNVFPTFTPRVRESRCADNGGIRSNRISRKPAAKFLHRRGNRSAGRNSLTMKIQIIHTPLQIHQGMVRQWVNGPNGWINGHWRDVRKAAAKDRRRIITVR